MKLRPCQAPDCRVTGVRPARLATSLASRRPSAGIWVSRPAAVTRDTSGIDVRISGRRASPSSSASRFPIAVSMAARCRSSCASLFLCDCFSNRCRPCVWRVRAAVRSLTSASRSTCSASRARGDDDEAAVGRRSTAAPICASTRAFTASVLARWPMACAKRRACTGLTRTHQRQPGLEQRFLEGAVPPAGRLVGDGANRHFDPRDQRRESRRVIGDPRGLAGGTHVHVEMRVRDVNTDGRIGHLSCSCACHSSLHAHVSIQDVGKDGGDHTARRPLDGPRRTRSDQRLPGGALPEASPGLGHLKAHSSPIVHRQAEDGAAVDTPGTRRYPGCFG